MTLSSQAEQLLFILYLALLGSKPSLAMITVQPDTEPTNQHLTALAIKVTNEEPVSTLLPDPLINLPDTKYLSECNGKNNLTYCGKHQSTCKPGASLDPNQNCIIWLAPLLPTDTEAKTAVSIKVNALPNTPWQKEIVLTYLLELFIGGVDFTSKSSAYLLSSSFPKWHPINPGNDSEIQAFALWNSDLYAGGRFNIPQASQ